jgi:hypothetical protein
MHSAIFGNVGTLISFRVGTENAKYLAREFYPVFTEVDLVNLPNHHIYLRLMIDGVSSKPFSLKPCHCLNPLIPHLQKILVKRDWLFLVPLASFSRAKS